MTKRKSWLTRLDEADQKAQMRLDKANRSDAQAIFRKGNKRAFRQTAEETTIQLAMAVYGLFIIEMCTLAGLALNSSNTQGTGTLAAGLQLFIWAAMLSLANIVMGIVALIKRPHLFYMRIPLIINCFIGGLVLIIML